MAEQVPSFGIDVAGAVGLVCKLAAACGVSDKSAYDSTGKMEKKQNKGYIIVMRKDRKDGEEAKK
jgi:hypothetical protein